jgi:cell wall-associated NlpC family hydrolase
MPMRSRLLLFTACIIQILLTSCHTGHQYASRSRKTTPPHFINDIYMDGHHKAGAKAEAIERVTYRRPPKNEEEPITGAADDRRSNEPVKDVAYASSDKEVSLKPGYKPEENDEPIHRAISRRESKGLRNKYSEILQVKPKDITNYPLYEFIDKWYGANYRLGGQDKSGIDCSGFAQKLYSEVYGIDLSRTAREQFSDSKHIKKLKKAEEGDLVFFHINSKRITHVGVYLANDYFVHASTSNGVIISNLNEEYYHKHFAGAGRIEE